MALARTPTVLLVTSSCAHVHEHEVAVPAPSHLVPGAGTVLRRKESFVSYLSCWWFLRRVFHAILGSGKTSHPECGPQSAREELVESLSGHGETGADMRPGRGRATALR
jgi:hypothetical protein